MRNKLYVAVLWVISGTVAIDAGAGQDLFNNPVGSIGVVSAPKPDFFSSPVAIIGSQAKSEAAVEKKEADKTVVVEAKPSTKSNHWSYQPIKRPAEPSVNDKNWVRNPIDAFVLAKLEAKGIKPSHDADRAAFIRRATLDVWGVIPTPEQVKDFVEDTAPNAYEKLADRCCLRPNTANAKPVVGWI